MKRFAMNLAFLSASLALAACSSGPKGFSETVDDTIENHGSEFEHCYQSALKYKDPDQTSPSGRIVMGFTVSPGGTVTEANVISSDVNNSRLEKCVQETLRRIKFQKNEEGRIIQTTHPFEFGKNFGGH